MGHNSARHYGLIYRSGVTLPLALIVTKAGVKAFDAVAERAKTNPAAATRAMKPGRVNLIEVFIIRDFFLLFCLLLVAAGFIPDRFPDERAAISNLRGFFKNLSGSHGKSAVRSQQFKRHATGSRTVSPRVIIVVKGDALEYRFARVACRKRGQHHDAEHNQHFDQMAERLVILPDPRLEPVRLVLPEAVRAAAGLVTPANFENILDPVIHGVLTGSFKQAGAHEGSIWLADEAGENLVIAFNSGANARDLVNRFKQPLASGMISLVFASEQPLCEHDVYRNQSHDPSLDKRLQVRTCSMIAVPFYFAQRTRGVLTCVQLKPAGVESPEPPGFTGESLKAIGLGAAILSRLLDHQLLKAVLGRG